LFGRYVRARSGSRGRRLASVHVRSQERHRHSVNVLMTFASVPTIRPLQKGQLVGRSTAMP